MSKKTLSLILTLLILTIILVWVAISANQSQKDQATNEPSAKTALPTQKVEGASVLSMMPNPSLPTSASTAARTVDVMIDTHGDTITTVQLEIAYNPALLTNMTLKPGSFFESPIVLPVGGINTKTGRITYLVTSGNLGSIKSGTGVVATLTFTPVAPAGTNSTPITLLEKSLILGRKGSTNITTSLLKSFSGTIVNF
ncbi:MAG: hypothetical protein KBC15_00635 [Candidatus Levybacteria bacterium]|nr:hypothetical protein [Candidatus Levybacteria bacterium]